MWRRVLFLLCIQIGFAVELTQSRAQPALAAASAPILSSCASTDDSSIQSICRMCPASTAYTISPDQLASLRGTFDDRTELLLLAVMNDLGLHLSAANYTITDSGERLCIAVSEFTRKPNANDLFQYFAGMPRATLAIPEIFSLKNTIDFRYMAVSVVYIDQQLVYDEVDFVFDAEATASVTGNITLALQEIEVTSMNRSYTTTYTGEAGMTGTSVPFSIVTPYARQPGTPFRVNLHSSYLYTLRQWLLLLSSPGSQCFSLHQPNGISSVFGLRPSFAAIDFHYNSSLNRAEFSQVVSYFSAPSFSFGPNMMLQSPSGQYQLNSDGTCRMLFAGQISSQSVHMNAIVESSDSEWYVSATPTSGNMTISDIEDLTDSLYPVFNKTLFPLYTTGEANIGSALRQLALSYPRIRFYYTPILFINIICEVPWRGTNALLEMRIGPVNGIVESVTSISQPVNAPQFGLDSDLSTSDLTLVTSTGDVNGTQYRHMLGDTAQTTEWRVGTYGFATLFRAEHCSHEFCRVLARASDQLSYRLAGNLLHGDLTLRTELPAFLLTPDILMSETALILDFPLFQPVLSIQGAFHLQVDSKTTLRFTGNITNIAGNAFISSRMQEIWTEVFDLPFVYIPNLAFTGEIVDNSIQNTDISGLGFIGTACYTPYTGFDLNNCLLGRISVSLNPSDYRQNSLIYRVNALHSATFLRYLLGVSLYNENNIPASLNGIDFSQSVDVQVNYTEDDQGNRVKITGLVRFYGVEGWMQADMTQLGVGKADINIDLEEFTIAEGNIVIRPDSLGKLQLQLPFDITNSVVEAHITASVSVWSMTSDTTLIIRDSGVFFTLQGTPFFGVYSAFLRVQSVEWSDLVRSRYEITGELRTRDVLRLSEIVRLDMRYWVSQGSDALTMGLNWVNNATERAAQMQNEACEAEECPYMRSCESAPSASCRVYSLSQSCSVLKPVCVTPTLTCLQYQEECILSTESCVTVQASQCTEWNTTCEETMSICTEWSTDCDGVNTGSCGEYLVQADTNLCLEMGDRCDMEHTPMRTCVNECYSSERIAQEQTAISQRYVEAFNLANSRLSTFRTLDSLTSASSGGLYTLTSVRIQTSFNSSAIGENDLAVLADFRTYSLTYLQPVSYTTPIPWDFQSDILNELTLFQAAKARLLSESSDTPFEVLIASFS